MRKFRKVVRFFRLALYHIKRFFFVSGFPAKFIHSRLVSIVLGTVALCYWKLVGSLGQQYEYVRQRQDFLESLFPVIVGLTVLAQVIRYIAEKYTQRDQSYTEDLENLLNTIEKIICAKTVRFESRVKKLKVSQSVFTTITHPIEQMDEIATEAVAFLSRQCQVSDEKFSITVIQVTESNAGVRNAEMLVRSNKTRNHTSPDHLLSVDSALSRCIETGDPVFYPDKQAAADDANYFLSRRDKSHDNKGSLYCEPVEIRIQQSVYRFVVTFSTYGHQICPVGNIEDEEAFKVFFRQFVRRFKLEMTLYAIKLFDEDLRSPKKTSPPRKRRQK
ncbi:hypothetical protein SAMN06265222_101618 [Neorhodopirellula lusitana]|uniref:GAF domain-containing protein n=2 Tax=Neorhodopirellula lusitana TaxID=445327 RepID=A0ABY1PQ25_9BACT|nr:hypothetical protein SAMN06265222_101618 [Neorhodopirellula lusitana]